MAWSEDRERLRNIRNDTGSALAQMGCKPRHNTVDAPTLYWAAIPGGEGDFPAEESFHTFIEQAACLFIGETNYAPLPRHSASRWRTGSAAGRCTWTSRTSR